MSRNVCLEHKLSDETLTNDYCEWTIWDENGDGGVTPESPESPREDPDLLLMRCCIVCSRSARKGNLERGAEGGQGRKKRWRRMGRSEGDVRERERGKEG